MVDKNLASMYVYRTALAWLRCREFSRSNPACCALALSKAIEFLCVSLDDDECLRIFKALCE